MKLKIKTFLIRIIILWFCFFQSSVNSEQVTKHMCSISKKENEIIIFCNFKSGQYGFKLSSDKSFYYGSFQKGEPDGAGVMHRAITDPKHKYFGGFELINGIWKFGKITDTNPDVETCTANKCQMIQSSIRFFKDEINSIFKTCSGRMISASELQGVCHYVDNNFIYIGNFISDNVRGEYVLIEFDELNSDYVKIQHGFFNHSGNETVYSRERVK